MKSHDLANMLLEIADREIAYVMFEPYDVASQLNISLAEAEEFLAYVDSKLDMTTGLNREAIETYWGMYNDKTN